MRREALAWTLLLLFSTAAYAALPPTLDGIQPKKVVSKTSGLPPAPKIAAAGPKAEPVLLARSGDVDEMSGHWDSEPDWDITPGVLCTPYDKDFEEYRYPERIAYCRRNISKAEKQEVSRWYGVAWEDHGSYQYDHLLSLCLGGSNNLHNLWPMPWDDARSKARLEFQLCERLRKGEVTQADAVREELGWFDENAPHLSQKFRGLAHTAIKQAK